MELYAVVGLGLKFERVKVLTDTSLPSGANGLLSSRSTCENFYMNDVVSLASQPGVKVDATIEYKVSWLEFFKFQNNW